MQIPPDPPISDDPERRRLREDAQRERNWKHWGPYLADRQWGTVREDYSADATSWDYFPHDHARSRVYRWGEDGLLGMCDRQGRLCLGLALWNERDAILKERLFGLSGPEGNHGEDVKECYYHLDSTPTHSYSKALYKYPQAAFPYARLLEENRRRTSRDGEFELEDTGIFDDNRYFDVTIEYAKADPGDVLVRVTIANRGPDEALLHVLPQLWFRNTWSWGRTGEGYLPRPSITLLPDGTALAEQRAPGGIGAYRFAAEHAERWLFTENETNNRRLWNSANASPYVKDAFHSFVVDGKADAVNPAHVGTKATPHYRLRVPAGGEVVLRLRLRAESAEEIPLASWFAPHARGGFDEVMRLRIAEADAFYEHEYPPDTDESERLVMRRAWAGLLWTKQFYYYVVNDWLEGDPSQPPPPAARLTGRNHEWAQHLYNRDVISMPDKWEYPWYAAWDLAFHMVPFAHIDPDFAKSQIELFVREWYMHPNGQMPAYEYAFSDVNPPVHAWAAWRVYKMTGPKGRRDRVFLGHVFQKCLLNFTWWVNRKDEQGRNLFAGGFLGLDNVGVFDRSKPLPTGGRIEQADGTAWMAFYCGVMLAMALELADEDRAYEGLASKFFEHFISITDAINNLGGSGLWDETDGFYYDFLHTEGLGGPTTTPLRVRSYVGIIPLFAAQILDDVKLPQLPGFKKRLDWFVENRPDLARHISYLAVCENRESRELRLLALPSRDRLVRVLGYVLDEKEFLSPYGIRSLSRAHLEHPYVLRAGGEEYRVDYSPAESTTGLFGGNSNWRGPVWFPINYLLVEALHRYHRFYGETLRIECPTGSGQMMNLREVANFLARRLVSLFLPDSKGSRPCNGDDKRYADDPHFRDLLLFHEYFHGETGKGLGASHQTGWTSLVTRFLEDTHR